MDKWNNIQLSWWATIIETATEQGINAPLRSAISFAFPNFDPDAFVSLHAELAQIAQLRGSSAHDSATTAEQRAKNSDDLWDLVVGTNGEGFLYKFYAALGLTVSGPGSAGAGGP